MRCLFLAAGLASGLLACRATGAHEPAPEREFFERGVLILDSADAAETFESMLDRLAAADVVFLGETHQDETTHRFERDVYAGLIERTGGRVVLALEMFSRDAQPVLDRYLAGEIDEQAFLAQSNPWGNYRTGYRPLIELAREHGLPVVASNVPAGLRRRVAAGEAEAFAALTEEERGWIAPELLTNSEAYWARFERVVRGHVDVSQGPESLLYSGQSQWDNTMGYSCAEALAAYPGFVVLHVNGGFHSAYHDGTVAQLEARHPGADVVTVAIDPVNDINAEGPEPDLALADFLVFADARARGSDGSFHAVRSQRELRYALSVPDTATDSAPVPLLIFLGDDGLRAEDSLAYWELALGDEAAVAVIEPPYPAVGEDLTPGGRWFWNETYHEDLATLGAGLAEVQNYVSRNYPVGDGVVLAGDGTGATVVARAVFHGAPVQALANRPAGYRKLREWPLPDSLGSAGASERKGPGLTVITDADDAAWWEQELAAYAEIGLESELETSGTTLRDLEHRVRVALGLPVPAAEAVAPAGAGSARERLWREIAARAQERGDLVPEVAELPALLASGEASGEALPPAPGLFGGTTILVVPADTPDAERTLWLALEDADVMAVHGRFFRLRVAFADATPGVADVLADLQAAGRSTALIVPAVFCEDAEGMRALAAEAADFAGSMQIDYLPGLGGRYARPPR